MKHRSERVTQYVVVRAIIYMVAHKWSPKGFCCCKYLSRAHHRSAIVVDKFCRVAREKERAFRAFEIWNYNTQQHTSSLFFNVSRHTSSLFPSCFELLCSNCVSPTTNWQNELSIYPYYTHYRYLYNLITYYERKEDIYFSLELQSFYLIRRIVQRRREDNRRYCRVVLFTFTF